MLWATEMNKKSNAIRAARLKNTLRKDALYLYKSLSTKDEMETGYSQQKGIPEI